LFIEPCTDSFQISNTFDYRRRAVARNQQRSGYLAPSLRVDFVPQTPDKVGPVFGRGQSS